MERKIRQAFPKIYSFRRKGRNFVETLKGLDLPFFLGIDLCEQAEKSI
jgi:hypothetical protein